MALGCVIAIFGMVRRRAELRMFVLPQRNIEYLKAKYRQYNSVSCICAILGAMLIGLTF